MANVYDAIIIGGGHNGLTSGAYFARAGARTVVLEARSKTGGAADTSAPFPDHPEIKVTTYSYVMSLMPPTIIRELNLKQHGYDVTPFGPYYQAFPDGRAITVYADDAKKSYDSIAQFSKHDAEILPKCSVHCCSRCRRSSARSRSATWWRARSPRGRCANSARVASRT